MQKKRCTALFGWMGDASAFMRPVKIFPPVETILDAQAGRSRAPSLQEIAAAANDQSRKSGQSPLHYDRFLYAPCDGGRCLRSTRTNREFSD